MSRPTHARCRASHMGDFESNRDPCFPRWGCCQTARDQTGASIPPRSLTSLEISPLISNASTGHCAYTLNGLPDSFLQSAAWQRRTCTGSPRTPVADRTAETDPPVRTRASTRGDATQHCGARRARRNVARADGDLGGPSRAAARYEPIRSICIMGLLPGIVRPGIASGAASRSTPSASRIAAVP